MAEEDDMAAQWDAALEGGEEDENTDSRVLNQDEIDSLLGFDSLDDDSDANTGVVALIEKALTAYEKLPMLEVVFDRLVRMMSTSLRNVTSDNVDVSIDSINSLRFGDYLNSIPLPALLVVFKAVEWENFGLITLDSALTFSFVDILMGGGRASRPLRVEGRPYTTIEQNLVRNIADHILNDMGAAFDPISPVTFEHDRLETNPRFATIARPSNAAILVRLRVDMEDRGGAIEILLPYSTLEPIRELLLQMFMGEKFGRDSSWDFYLSRELKHTDVQLEAILAQKQITLKDVMQFQVGSTLLLDRHPDDDIAICCGSTPVLHGKIGKQGNNVAIQINSMLEQAKEEDARL